MRTLFVILLGCLAFIAQAQPAQKIGSADFDYIFSQLPDAKQIEAEMKTHQAQLESQFNAKRKEYTDKLDVYQKLPASTPDAIRKDKETELQALGQSIQQFQQDANTSSQKKYGELMDPIYKKVAKAIESVAKENGYSFIIGQAIVGGGDIILYNDETYNISTLVLKKLGVTPTAATTPAKTN